MGNVTGDNHGRFKGGVHTSDKGYRRISTKHNRMKYEHRVKAEEVLGRPLHYFGPNHSLNEVVHHLDHDRQHNCLINFLICPKIIHDFMTRDANFYRAEHIMEWNTESNTKGTNAIQTETNEAPDWVTSSSEPTDGYSQLDECVE